MTEFEQQVATALTATRADDATGTYYGLPGFIAQRVAPRVAAAIQAACAGDSDMRDEMFRQEALRALRGER